MVARGGNVDGKVLKEKGSTFDDAQLGPRKWVSVSRPDLS